MKNKPIKGTYGYLEKQKKRVLIRTILFFAISLAVYLIGYFSTGSNQNYMTIVAVLGCLPASKSAVNTVMYYRYKGCSSQDHKKIEEHTGNLLNLYDMVFTSYEKNFEIHHVALKDTSLIGYTGNNKCDISACEKHLRSLLSQNSLKLNVKIFNDLPKYLNRLDQFSGSDINEQESAGSQDPERDQTVLALLRAISL